MAELLFAPLIDRIRTTGGQVLGSQLVEEVTTGDDGAVTSVVARCQPPASPPRSDLHAMFIRCARISAPQAFRDCSVEMRN